MNLSWPYFFSARIIFKDVPYFSSCVIVLIVLLLFAPWTLTHRIIELGSWIMDHGHFSKF